MNREYPNVDGWPEPLAELELPESKLDQSNKNNFNNHHMFWPRRAFGRLAISQTIRDLEKHQIILPRDTHSLIHSTYDPAPRPSIHEMMTRIEFAKSIGERLRTGFANHTYYRPITDDLWQKLLDEYDDVV